MGGKGLVLRNPDIHSIYSAPKKSVHNGLLDRIEWLQRPSTFETWTFEGVLQSHLWSHRVILILVGTGYAKSERKPLSTLSQFLDSLGDHGEPAAGPRKKGSGERFGTCRTCCDAHALIPLQATC